MIFIESNKKIEQKTNNIADKTYQLLNLSGQAKIELLFVSKTKIKQLNKDFRNIDKVTDVLSFPMLNKILPFNKANYPLDLDENGRVNLGSVIICVKKAEENASEYGHSIERELNYLFVHGLLHLLGYDHIKEEEKGIMRELEESILEDNL